MGNWIMVNGKDILKLSNIEFDFLHEKIDNLLQDKNIKDEVVLNFVERMDQNIYGGGLILLDIDKFFKFSPASLLIFINLVKEATDQIVTSVQYRIGFPEAMNDFIHELEIYYDKVK